MHAGERIVISEDLAIAEYFAIGFENSAAIATRLSGVGGYLHVCWRQDSCVAFSVGL